MELFTWGSGNYGRLGLGNCADARFPQRVSGVLNGYEVTSGGCGWYHSAVVTSTGDVATFGSKVTKCLGTEVDGSDVSSSEGADEEEDQFFGYHGPEDVRKPRTSRDKPQQRNRPRPPPQQPGNDHCSAAFVPQVLRSFPSRVTIVQVAVGGDMLGAHTLAVTRSGKLYSWGFGAACGLGTQATVSTPTLVTKFLGFGINNGQVTSQMEPLAPWRHSHLRYRKRVPERHLGLQVMRPRIVKAACGGGFSVVLSSEGEVFTFGLSAGGRLGFRTKFRAQLRPRRVETLKEGITDISAGSGFALLCSAPGRLLAWGDNTKGQLGIGHLQESYEPAALGRACPAAFVFQAVAAGDSHSLALDSAGKIYSWGGEGGPMTGQGQPMTLSAQVDVAYQFRLRALPHWWVRPAPVRALMGHRAIHIAAGCLHSLALTSDGCLYAWGAALQAAASPAEGVEASAARLEAAWIPRLITPSPKMPLARVAAIAAGGWHSMAAASSATPLQRLLVSDLEGETTDMVPEEKQQLQNLFCDGFLVSVPDSTPVDEAKVPVCCAALRARLALPNGQDSPAWDVLSSLIRRIEPPRPILPVAQQHTAQADSCAGAPSRDQQRPPLPRGFETGNAAEATEAPHAAAVAQATAAAAAAAQGQVAGKDGDGDDEDDDDDGLMEIVEMHRQRATTVQTASKPQGAVSLPSDADEAAGKAIAEPKARPEKPIQLRKQAKGHLGNEEAPSPLPQQQRQVPDFSSDSSSSEPKGKRMRAPPQQHQQQRQSAPGHADVRAIGRGGSSSSTAGSPLRPRRPFKSKAAMPALPFSECSEAVLVALIRFLLTDNLSQLEVIDESHPAWQREQHLKCLPVGNAPGDPPGAEGVGSSSLERPSKQRAACGQLLRTEVSMLRSLGVKLGLERLSQLCSQLLLRMDAPGAPALYVPTSAMDITMSTLLAQAFNGPSLDGPDTRILCGPRSQHTQRFGPQRVPSNGVVYAHAFMLCAQCRNIQVLPANTADAIREYQGTCWLQPCSVAAEGSAVRFELDLRDVSADVVFAWLRYLYRHEDLTLVWPCREANSECVVLAESFWTALLRLGIRTGDETLQHYAQDVLVECLSPDNWTHLAVFAEQSQCQLLCEAALMTGVRLLIAPVLKSFKVPTGLESAKGEDVEDPEPAQDAAEAAAEQAATAGRVSFTGQTMPGRTGSSYSQVDLDMEKHLLSFSSRDIAFEQELFLALRKGSPTLFAELKHRLAERVISAQRAAKQLHQCAHFFDMQEKNGGLSDGKSARRLWLELFAVAAIISLFLLPTPFRKAAFKQMQRVAPTWMPGWKDLSWFGVPTALRMGIVNTLVVTLISTVLWVNLKH